MDLLGGLCFVGLCIVSVADLIVYIQMNKEIAAIRAKQIKLDGWVRSKEERLIK